MLGIGAALKVAVVIAAALQAPRVVKLPYTPCGGSCTSDGFAAGGTPGVWVGQICPGKCAECQSDGVIPPVYNSSQKGSLTTNHWCETSPDALYLEPTSVQSSDFAVSVLSGHSNATTGTAPRPVEVIRMKDYVGFIQYAAFSVAEDAWPATVSVSVDAVAVANPANHTLKPQHRAPVTTFDRSTATITFTLREPGYFLLQFGSSGPEHVLLIFADPAQLSPGIAADPGVSKLRHHVGPFLTRFSVPPHPTSHVPYATLNLVPALIRC